MKKLIFGCVSLILGFVWVNNLSAADSIEHFATKDGRHFCSVFMKNDFKSCEEFGIKYDGDKVVAGEKPFFAAGYPNRAKITVAAEVFCVEWSATDTGREVDMAKCSTASGSTLPEKETISLETIDDNPSTLSTEMASGSMDESSGTTESVSGSTELIESSWSVSEWMTDITSEAGSGDTSSTGTAIQEAALSGEIPPVQTVQSSSTCKVNGKEVNCDEMVAWAKSIVKTGFGILGIILVLSFIFGIFWLWMLIHAMSNHIPNKTLWVLVIFFLYPIGAIVYYFVVKRKFVPVSAVNQVPPEGTGNMQVAYQTVPMAPVETSEILSGVLAPAQAPTYEPVPTYAPIVTPVAPIVTSPIIVTEAPIVSAPISPVIISTPEVMSPVMPPPPTVVSAPPAIETIPSNPVVPVPPPVSPNQGQNV